MAERRSMTPTAPDEGRQGSRARSQGSDNPRALRTRAALIDAVTDLADRRLAEASGSPTRLTIAEVSRAAGVSPSSFYAHFEGVPALVRAALEHHLETVEFDYLERFDRSGLDLSADDLRQVLAEVLAEFDRFHGLLVTGPAPQSQDQPGGGVLEVFRVSVAASLIRRPPGLPGGALDLVSQFVAGGILSTYLAHPGAQERDQVLDVLVAMIRPLRLTARPDPDSHP